MSADRLSGSIRASRISRNGEMHELLFGGITLQYLDDTTATIEADFALPFVNDITAVVVDADGNYSQHHLGKFPELFDGQNRLLRFGANAEFLAAEGIPTFENGVIQFDALGGETTLGYIFGGIVANAPHTRRNPGELSAGSNYVFEVVLIAVPEPTTNRSANERLYDHRCAASPHCPFWQRAADDGWLDRFVRGPTYCHTWAL